MYKSCAGVRADWLLFFLNFEQWVGTLGAGLRTLATAYAQTLWQCLAQSNKRQTHETTSPT